MSLLGKFIADDTPKFNKMVAEGICYHKLKDAVRYIDNFIKYDLLDNVETHLRYLGCRVLRPEEVVNLKFKKSSGAPHDIAENTMTLVEYSFQYGEEETVRKHNMYIPYMKKGNILTIGGKDILGMATLTDKVISIGEKTIFINIVTAKYNFTRLSYTVLENDVYKNVSLITAVLYINQPKRITETTKAKSTIIHYLLAYYGYSKTMEILLGFVPTPVYDAVMEDGKVVYSSNGKAPRGWIGDKKTYQPNRIRFVVDEGLNSQNVLYVLGNVMYVLDHFPGQIPISDLDNPDVWRRFMGEIIHTGHYGVAYLKDKMDLHFERLSSRFSTSVINKLKDRGIDATYMFDFLVVIFMNFNDWILSNNGSTSLYYNKTLEVESFLLKKITSSFNLLLLNIIKEESKEELRLTGRPLDPKQVDKLFKMNLKESTAFGLRSDPTITQSIEDSTDHSYFKKTAFIANQESDFANVASGQPNTAAKSKLHASMATTGSFLNLSKKNPTPTIRLNPTINIDPLTGTVLPNPLVNEIVEKTQVLIENTVMNFGVSDLGNEEVDSIEIDELDLDDYGEDDYEDVESDDED